MSSKQSISPVFKATHFNWRFCGDIVRPFRRFLKGHRQNNRLVIGYLRGNCDLYELFGLRVEQQEEEDDKEEKKVKDKRTFEQKQVARLEAQTSQIHQKLKINK